MALTALPSGMYAEETVWEEETDASEETLDGGLDESAEEFADGLPDYIPEPETDVVDGAADDESADELSEQEESLIEEETTPDLPDFIPEEEPPTLEESELPPVQAGEFVWVTPNTRVYLEIDETAGDDDDGEWYDGNFVNEANVYVEQAQQDAQGRTWLLVRYLYEANLKVYYLNKYIVKMRMGGLSTDAGKSKLKWAEDLRMYKSHGIKPISALKGKILSKIPQFIEARLPWSEIPEAEEESLIQPAAANKKNENTFTSSNLADYRSSSAYTSTIYAGNYRYDEYSYRRQAEAGNSDVGRKLSAQTDDACTIRLQHRKLLCEHQFLFLSGTCLSGNFNKRGLYIIQA